MLQAIKDLVWNFAKEPRKMGAHLSLGFSVIMFLYFANPALKITY